ncbi:hypothetical protein ACRALDRAFT_208878 [Sodiomyces alcalophilus JCM 7366]|uniref:uncharacterized protein n=1 Tax=Sodiomyces alcalophilus JCM 7366 TaxID=591952 RepID=UPI0039B4BB17
MLHGAGHAMHYTIRTSSRGLLLDPLWLFKPQVANDPFRYETRTILMLFNTSSLILPPWGTPVGAAFQYSDTRSRTMHHEWIGRVQRMYLIITRLLLALPLRCLSVSLTRDGDFPAGLGPMALSKNMTSSILQRRGSGRRATRVSVIMPIAFFFGQNASASIEAPCTRLPANHRAHNALLRDVALNQSTMRIIGSRQNTSWTELRSSHPVPRHSYPHLSQYIQSESYRGMFRMPFLFSLEIILLSSPSTDNRTDSRSGERGVKGHIIIHTPVSPHHLFFWKSRRPKRSTSASGSVPNYGLVSLLVKLDCAISATPWNLHRNMWLAAHSIPSNLAKAPQALTLVRPPALSLGHDRLPRTVILYHNASPLRTRARHANIDCFDLGFGEPMYGLIRQLASGIHNNGDMIRLQTLSIIRPYQTPGILFQLSTEHLTSRFIMPSQIRLVTVLFVGNLHIRPELLVAQQYVVVAYIMATRHEGQLGMKGNSA